MKVTIVKKKSECEMTIEELSRSTKFVAIVCGQHKYLYSNYADTDEDGYEIVHPYFVRCVPCDEERFGVLGIVGETKRTLFIRLAESSTFHVFDTAKELYLWMAE